MTPAADDERRNRPLAAVIVLFIALAAIASLVIVSAFRFDVPAVGRFSALIGGGGASLELLRWGAILDLGSYLAMGVVILFLGERLRSHSPGVVAALTTSGLGAVLVGAIGAAVLASVGPWLLSEHASGSPSVRDAARVGLDAMGRMVLAGLWGTLELSMLGAWLFGIGWLQRGGSPRQAALALFGGAAMVASSLRTGLTGRSLVEVAGPLDLIVVLATFVGFAALFGWLLAVALTLWRAPAART